MMEKPFRTIPKAAKYTGLSINCLRKKHKEGKLTGTYSGNRFYVDIIDLREKIRRGEI